MKSTTKRSMAVRVAAVLTLVCIIFVTSSYAATATPFEQFAPSDAVIDVAIKNEVAALDISKGVLRNTAEKFDAYNNKQLILEDDAYRYFVDAETKEIVSGVLIDSSESIAKKASLSRKTYLSLARQFTEDTFKSLDSSAVEYIASYDENNPLEYVSYRFEEKVGDIIVNSGYLSFTIDGKPCVFGATRNSISDFDNTDNYSKNDIQEIVFKAIWTEKAAISESAQILRTDISDVKMDPPLQKGEIDPEEEQANKPYTQQIKLEILANDMNDLKFGEIVKAKMGDRVVWLVESQVQTTWGEIDPIFNFIYAFAIDAVSGEIVEAHQLSGS